MIRLTTGKALELELPSKNSDVFYGRINNSEMVKRFKIGLSNVTKLLINIRSVLNDYLKAKDHLTNL